MESLPEMQRLNSREEQLEEAYRSSILVVVEGGGGSRPSKLLAG